MEDKKNILYDACVIGAGMSGLACAIRLSMAGLKVALVEKHSIPGGLNSYYYRKDSSGKRQMIDVGLHALTNYTDAKIKGPLSKILKQLRIRHADLNLIPQKKSLIKLREKKLEFSNDFELLKKNIQQSFPEDYLSFLEIHDEILNFNEFEVAPSFRSSLDFLKNKIRREDLVNLIMAPLLIYGSCWAKDMDLPQFVIMYKAIYLEGFAQINGGVKHLIDILIKKVKEGEVEIFYSTRVKKITNSRIPILNSNSNSSQNIKMVLAQHPKYGELEIKAHQVYSSTGKTLTDQFLVGDYPELNHDLLSGDLTFVESLIIIRFSSAEEMILRKNHLAYSIIFHSELDLFIYEKPNDYFSSVSAVICFPQNFASEKNLQACDELDFTIRVTYLASYQKWKEFSATDYEKSKNEVMVSAKKLMNQYFPFSDSEIILSDVFTPLTIEKFTAKPNGAVYGNPQKFSSGQTVDPNVFLIGTDQGFLGITGSLLSGISIGNAFGVMKDLRQTQIKDQMKDQMKEMTRL